MLFELFTNPGESPRSPRCIVRRFILWSLVCWVSAAPSFWMAVSFTRGSSSPHFDPWAMAAAIVLFTCLYTILTSTDAFERFHRIHGMRRTLYIGYWTRMAISVAFPLAMFVDILTGMVSVLAVQRVLGEGYGFANTFIITCLHGTIMNLIIALYMAILFPIVRALTRNPLTRPGFEVILPAASGWHGQIGTPRWP